MAIKGLPNIGKAVLAEKIVDRLSARGMPAVHIPWPQEDAIKDYQHHLEFTRKVAASADKGIFPIATGLLFQAYHLDVEHQIHAHPPIGYQMDCLQDSPRGASLAWSCQVGIRYANRDDYNVLISGNSERLAAQLAGVCDGPRQRRTLWEMIADGEIGL